jgi:hypothetical protein
MATYEGMGLCEPREYHAAFESRLTHDQLTRGELYVARFKIEGLKVGYRVLGRVGLMATASGEPTRLEFQMLNDDLRHLDIPPEGEMSDGLWNSKDGVVYQVRPGAKYYDMRDGCFANYEDGDGFDLEVMLMLERGRDLNPI